MCPLLIFKFSLKVTNYPTGFGMLSDLLKRRDGSGGFETRVDDIIFDLLSQKFANIWHLLDH